jgi:hypothetical protein
MRNKDHLKQEVLERFQTEKKKEQIARDLIDKYNLPDNPRSLARWVCYTIQNQDTFDYTGTPYLGSDLKEYMAKVMQDKGSYDLLVFSDTHGWFADLKVLGCINKIVQSNHFDEICINGDVIDLPYISAHSKKLYNDGILNGYSEVEEIRYTTEQILKPLRLSTKAKIRLRYGNHCDRIRKPFLLNKGQLASLAILYKTFETTKLDEMLKLDSLDIISDESDIFNYFGLFDITHGLSLAKNAGERNIQSYMGSGTSSHTHRLNAKYYTTKKGMYVWVETGCTRLKEQVEYFPTGIIPDWQTGFVHVHFYKQNGEINFNAQPYCVIDGRCYYNGKIHDGNFK